MTDTKTNEARDAKGNLIPKEVWLTCGDLPGHDYPYLMSVSAKPWDGAYDAAVTKWASNVRYVPADLLADMTRQRDEARTEGFAAGLKAASGLMTRQRDEARAEGFAAGLEAATKEISSLARPDDIPGGCLIPDTFDEGASAAFDAVEDLLRALAEGAKP